MTDIRMARIKGEVTNLFYNRLHIELYNGLTWTTDIRNYKNWLNVFMKNGVNSIMTELHEEDMYEKMIERMVEYELTYDEINRILYGITGKWFGDWK